MSSHIYDKVYTRIIYIDIHICSPSIELEVRDAGGGHPEFKTVHAALDEPEGLHAGSARGGLGGGKRSVLAFSY